MPGAPQPVVIARELPGSREGISVRREFDLAPAAEPGDELEVVVTYADLQGCQWESRLSVKVNEEARPQPGRMTRRITLLPPKRSMP
jgi:hypothetical protein